jgi:nucleotide-binding universal stress UspA family protein
MPRDVGFKQILVAFDGSGNALRACEVVASLAKGYSSEVTILQVIPSISVFAASLADRYYALLNEEAEIATKKAASVFEKEGEKARREIVQTRASIVETIVEYASSAKSDLIVAGTRGFGDLKRMMIGSVSSGLATHAPCSVLVVRMQDSSSSEKPEQLKRIMVAVDGSEQAERALRTAIDLAKILRTELTVLYVMALPWAVYSGNAPLPGEEFFEGLREEGEKVTAEATALAENGGVRAKSALKEGVGSPVRAITEYAVEERIDLIVVGTRGLGGFKKLVLGSVASGVLHYAHCSVLVARRTQT